MRLRLLVHNIKNKKKGWGVAEAIPPSGVHLSGGVVLPNYSQTPVSVPTNQFIVVDGFVVVVNVIKGFLVATLPRINPMMIGAHVIIP